MTDSQIRLNAAAAQTATTHRVTEGGTDYLVAPVVAIREGIYRYPTQNGTVSEYLPGEELLETESDWDGKPLLLDHPLTVDGRPAVRTSDGLDPATVREIGEVRNPSVERDRDGHKLRAEAWIDLSTTNEFDDVERIADALESGELVETSTGYRNPVVPSGGRFDGERYDAEQRARSADHLAVFAPGTKAGNCSVDGGCGVGRLNQAPETDNEMTDPTDDEPDGDRTPDDDPDGGDDPGPALDDGTDTDVDDAVLTRIGQRVLSAIGAGAADAADVSAAGATANSEPGDCGCGGECDDCNSTTNMSDNENELRARLIDEDDVPFGEATLNQMTDDELTSVEERFLGDETTNADDDGDSDGGDGPDDGGEPYDEPDSDPDSDDSPGDGGDAELESEIESLRAELREIKEEVNKPVKEMQEQAAEQVTANMDGVEADDIELSPEAAQRILAEGGQQQSPQPTANMAAVRQPVSRTNEEDIDVGSGSYDAHLAAKDGGD